MREFCVGFQIAHHTCEIGRIAQDQSVVKHQTQKDTKISVDGHQGRDLDPWCHNSWRLIRVQKEAGESENTETSEVDTNEEKSLPSWEAPGLDNYKKTNTDYCCSVIFHVLEKNSARGQMTHLQWPHTIKSRYTAKDKYKDQRDRQQETSAECRWQFKIT